MMSSQRKLLALSKVRLGMCEEFRIRGTFLAQIVKIYDGDTVTVCLDVSRAGDGTIGDITKLTEHSVRMFGYDAPELKPLKSKSYEGSRFASRDEEIEAAKAARDYLAGLILHTPVRLEILENSDKYGRLLGTVYAYPKMREWLSDDTSTQDAPKLADFTLNVNDEMISKGHGYPYFGGTKEQ